MLFAVGIRSIGVIGIGVGSTVGVPQQRGILVEVAGKIAGHSWVVLIGPCDDMRMTYIWHMLYDGIGLQQLCIQVALVQAVIGSQKLASRIAIPRDLICQ